MTATAYATPADLLKRYDARSVGDLVNDAGSRQTPTQILTDPNVLACLDDGAAYINAAAIVGNRYTIAQLQALTGVDAAMLIRLNCDLTFGYLVLRRGNDPRQLQSFVDAEKILGLLREGQLIFDVPASLAVGVGSSNFPSPVAYATLNLYRDECQAFPVRSTQNVTSGY